MDLSKHYTTENLDQAASLEALGHICTVQMVTSDKAIFIFPKSELLEESAAKFYQGTLLVPPTILLKKRYALYQKITSLKFRGVGR